MKKSPLFLHCCISILLTFFHQQLFAQTNYYQTLLTELENDYNLIGGEWVIGGNENLLEEGGYVNVSPQFNTQNEPIFERSVQMNITNPGPNPWTQRVNYSTLSDVAEGDLLLLSCFIRNHGGGGVSQMVFSFQELNPPWTISIYQGVEIPSNGQWYQVFFPFHADLNHPLGETILQLQLGFEAIDFEMGGLAVINYKQQYSLDELPHQEVFYYDGIEADALWRTAAQARIETHRKADLEMTLVDANGQAIPNAEVHVELINPLFKYGTVDEGGGLFSNNPNEAFYQQEFFRLFNYGSVGVFWGATDFDDYASEIALANLMQNNGFDIRITPVLWGTIGPQWASTPPDVTTAIQNGDAAYVRTRIEERLQEVSTVFGNRITDFEVLNEPTHVRNFQNLLGANEYLSWYERMRQLNPTGKLFINDFEILSFGAQVDRREAYKAIIENMLMNNTPLDGIGFQSHMFGEPTPPERVYNVLEEFAQLGKQYGRTLDLKITEYDTDGMGDELAAQYLGDFMTAAFSHPQISSFTLWGFADAHHWLDDAPLYNLDYSPKPALAVYEDLVFNQWWTEETLNTDSEGKIILRGFKGDYQIQINLGENRVEKAISLTEDTAITCTLDAITNVNDLVLNKKNISLYPSLAKIGQSVFLKNNGIEAITRLEVYNALGQSVFYTRDISSTFEMPTQDWIAGIYFLKASFENRIEVVTFELY